MVQQCRSRNKQDGCSRVVEGGEKQKKTTLVGFSPHTNLFWVAFCCLMVLFFVGRYLTSLKGRVASQNWFLLIVTHWSWKLDGGLSNLFNDDDAETLSGLVRSSVCVQHHFNNFTAGKFDNFLGFEYFLVGVADGLVAFGIKREEGGANRGRWNRNRGRARWEKEIPKR